MDLIRRSETWKEEHRNSKIIGVFRILLGLVFVFKGLYFIHNGAEIQSRLAQSVFQFGDIAIAHYITLVHIAGGLLIAAGFLTRVSILFQLPILIGALLFANAGRGMFPLYSEFLLVLVVLFGSLFFLFYGSGDFSLQRLLKRNIFYQ